MKKKLTSERRRITTQDMYALLKEQCSKFPTPSEFDYRTLIKDGLLDEHKPNT